MCAVVEGAGGHMCAAVVRGKGQVGACVPQWLKGRGIWAHMGCGAGRGYGAGGCMCPAVVDEGRGR